MNLETLHAWCATDLPAIGSGDTASRWLQLFDWARTEPLSTARLAEAHHDAMQILHEAELCGDGSIYGVWASARDGEALRFDPEAMSISGTKAFCSGLGVVDRALVTAEADNESFLLDIDLGDRSLGEETMTTDTSRWNTMALADTATGSVHFEGHRVDRVVGIPGWYLTRPGFWHGAIGPAACWAGGAAGIIDTPGTSEPSSIHRQVALGELIAERHLLHALLEDAGRRADRAPTDVAAARRTAYSARYLVERSTARVIDSFERAFGPRPLVSNPELNQRIADVRLYTRQHHGDRDLAELGGTV